MVSKRSKDAQGRIIKMMDETPGANDGVPLPPVELEGCEVMWDRSYKKWVFYDPKNPKARITAAAAFKKYGGEIRVLVPGWEHK